SSNSNAGPFTRPGVLPKADTPITPLPEVPKIDIKEAPAGTDFGKAEAKARADFRKSNKMKEGEQVHHSLSSRSGERTGLHPEITNHPRNLVALQDKIELSGGKEYPLGKKTYYTEHDYAEALSRQHKKTALQDYGNKYTERAAVVKAQAKAFNEAKKEIPRL